MGCYLCNGTGVTRYGAGYDSESIVCPSCNGCGDTSINARSPNDAAVEWLRNKGGTIEYEPRSNAFVVRIPAHGTFLGDTPQVAVRKAWEAMQ